MVKLAREISAFTNRKAGHTSKKVSDAMLEKMDRFERRFPDGVYVEPRETKEPKVRFRALSKYCAEHGKKPAELTDEERERFIIREKD